MSRVIYEEHLFSKGVALGLGMVSAIMLGLTLQQWLTGSSGDQPAWLNPALFLFFLLLTLNFARLDVVITDEWAIVGYGIIRSRTRWRDIEDCYPDEASAVRYGGFGIRFGWYEGRRRLVYNTIGTPRVVLLRKNRSVPELVFSTDDPQRAVAQVCGALGETARR